MIHDVAELVRLWQTAEREAIFQPDETRWVTTYEVGGLGVIHTLQICQGRNFVVVEEVQVLRLSDMRHWGSFTSHQNTPGILVSDLPAYGRKMESLPVNLRDKQMRVVLDSFRRKTQQDGEEELQNSLMMLAGNLMQV